MHVNDGPERQSAENLGQTENISKTMDTQTDNPQVLSNSETEENRDEMEILSDLDDGVGQDDSHSLLKYFEQAAASRGRRTAPLAIAEDEMIIHPTVTDLITDQNNPIPLAEKEDFMAMVAALEIMTEPQSKERTWTETEVESFTECGPVQATVEEIQENLDHTLELVILKTETQLSEDTKSMDLSVDVDYSGFKACL
jgi:hypothetical protein